MTRTKKTRLVIGAVLAVLATMALGFVVATTAIAKPGGGSKSSCCKTKKTSPGGKAKSKQKVDSSSKPRHATASKPSTGKLKQPVPVKQLIPAKPLKLGGQTTGGSFLDKSPGTRRTVDTLGQRGRNWNSDYATINRNPRYADPAYHGRSGVRGLDSYGYMGYSDSPLNYMFLGAFLDGDRDYPQPPEANGTEISEATVSYLGVLEAQRKLIDEAEK